MPNSSLKFSVNENYKVERMGSYKVLKISIYFSPKLRLAQGCFQILLAISVKFVTINVKVVL